MDEGTVTLTKPMGEYTDFDDCVTKNQTKDPEAYCGAIKQKIEGKSGDTPEKRHLLMPLVRKNGKLMSTLTDDSIDRDEEFMSPSLVKSYCEVGVLTALFDHQNKMNNWAGGFKDTKFISKSVNGVERSAMNAEFVPLRSNPHTSWIIDAIDEAEEKGIPLPAISIGAIPQEFEDVKIGEKSYRMWTKAELCEASLVPYGSNRNAVVTIAKAMKTYGLIQKSGDYKPQIKENNAMEEDLLKKISEQLTKQSESIDILKTEIVGIKKEMEDKPAPAPAEPEKDDKPAEPEKDEAVKAPTKPVLNNAPIIIQKTNPEEFTKGVSCMDLIKKAYPGARGK